MFFTVLLELDNKNIETHWDYAEFLKDQRRYQKALHHYQVCEALSINVAAKAIFQINQGVMLRNMNDYENAEIIYFKST